MKILISGSNGQVGFELVRLLKDSHIEYSANDVDVLDITDFGSVAKAIKNYMPDWVVNAAAYTAVDLAEKETEIAYSVNRDGVRNLAKVCADLDIPLFHISTDYVFDGNSDEAYREDDLVSPLGVYGKSKWEGEEAVRECCSKYIILRTAWVFGAHGKNFVKTILNLAQTRETLSVVSDQFGCPTAAQDIASAIISIITQNKENWGAYHYAGAPPTSWYEFASNIVDQAKSLTKISVKDIHPISTQEYPTPARRPANSVLDCSKINSVFGLPQPDWHISLNKVLTELFY